MIYLDMDNTLVDLNFGIHVSLGRKGPMVTKPGIYDLATLFGCDVKLGDRSYNWWANLPRTFFATNLVECVLANFNRQDIAVCSTVVTPEAATGKINWLRANYPFLAERFVLLNLNKEVCCSGLNDVLIDDYDVNNKRWKESGGFAITVPQPWNGLHGHDVMNHIEHEIASYKTMIGVNHG